MLKLMIMKVSTVANDAHTHSLSSLTETWYRACSIKVARIRDRLLQHGLILGFDVLVDPCSICQVLVTRPSEGVQDDAIASAVALDHSQKILDGELEHSARSGGNLSDFTKLVIVLYV